MPGPTLPNMGIVQPLVAGDSGTWGGELNSALALIDVHDHTPGKGVLVPVSGININTDVSLGSTHALSNALAVDFALAAAASVAGYAGALFVSDGTGGLSANELYWRTTSGTNVKLTAGNSINTTLVGGIVGDYTAVSAQVAYDNANLRYTFKQGGAVNWAKMASSDVRIYPTGSGSVFVALAAPGGIGSNYTLTFPSAVPASTVAVQVSAAGALSFSNTFASALVAPDFKVNAARVLALGAQAFTAIGSNARVTDGAGNTAVNLSGGTTTAGLATMVIPLCTGDRVTSVKVFIQKTSNATNTISTTLRDLDISAGTTFSTDTATNAVNNPGFTTITITPASPHAIVANHVMTLCIGMSIGAATTDNAFGAEISYDRP